MTELEHTYNAELGERKPLDNGSYRYPLKIVKNGEETILETSYTVSPRQEDRLEKMVEKFTRQKALSHEGKLGEDKSNTKVEV